VARANLPQDRKVALFCQWAEANNATVARVGAAEVPGEVVAYLARNNLPAEAAMAPSPLLEGFDWASQKMLSLRRGRGEGSDHVSLTGAFAGIAETGTVVTASGPDHPVTGSYPQIRKFIASLLVDLPAISLDGVSFQRQKIGDPQVESQIKLIVP
jgi:L-lactate dehydrogenase complex protein LldG